MSRVGWDDDLHHERSFGDESWVDEWTTCSQAAKAFLDWNLAVARAAYEPLLEGFERHAEEMRALRYIGGEKRLAQQSVRRGCHALALRGPAVAHRGRRLAELAREPDRVTP
jgi:hypothetical protein